MTPPELESFQSIRNVEFNTYWIPCTWFIHHLRCLKEEDSKLDSNGLKLIMEVLRMRTLFKIRLNDAIKNLCSGVKLVLSPPPHPEINGYV